MNLESDSEILQNTFKQEDGSFVIDLGGGKLVSHTALPAGTRFPAKAWVNHVRGVYREMIREREEKEREGAERKRRELDAKKQQEAVATQVVEQSRVVPAPQIVLGQEAGTGLREAPSAPPVPVSDDPLEYATAQLKHWVAQVHLYQKAISQMEQWSKIVKELRNQ